VRLTVLTYTEGLVSRRSRSEGVWPP